MRKMNLNGQPKYDSGCNICTDYSVGISCLFMRLDKCSNVDDKHVVI